MKSRYIAVPKDKDAEIDLDYGRATSEQLFEIHMTPSEYEELEEKGVFDHINEIADAMIRDYEDDAITEKEKLEQVLGSDVFDQHVSTDKLLLLKTLFQEALQRNTGVYFYF